MEGGARVLLHVGPPEPVLHKDGGEGDVSFQEASLDEELIHPVDDVKDGHAELGDLLGPFDAVEDGSGAGGSECSGKERVSMRVGDVGAGLVAELQVDHVGRRRRLGQNLREPDADLPQVLGNRENIVLEDEERVFSLRSVLDDTDLLMCVCQVLHLSFLITILVPVQPQEQVGGYFAASYQRFEIHLLPTDSGGYREVLEADAPEGLLDVLEAETVVPLVHDDDRYRTEVDGLFLSPSLRTGGGNLPQRWEVQSHHGGC
mmetsp:Transcript_32748/g.103621  ORF Transcript_32748/g.103621 Transcript_32748/m.103621 type:complete len:260 (+) Transcript_32748:290-1069(+)